MKKLLKIAAKTVAGLAIALAVYCAGAIIYGGTKYYFSDARKQNLLEIAKEIEEEAAAKRLPTSSQ